MSYQTITLQAGIPHRLDIECALILIDAVSTADGVDLQTLDRGGAASVVIPGRKAAFRLTGKFEGVILSAAVVTTVSLFLSKTDVQLGVVDGSAVSIPNGVRVINSDAQPVPVKTPAGQPLEVSFAGTVAPVLGVITNSDAQAIPVKPQIGAIFTVEQATEVDTRPYLAAAVANVAPVAVTAVAAALVAASATRRGLRLRNVGANPVALGGAGVTFAGAAVVIQPGETWNENEAPGAAWYVICDAALASTVNVQTIT